MVVVLSAYRMVSVWKSLGDSGSSFAGTRQSRDDNAAQVVSPVMAVNNNIYWSNGEQCLEFFGLLLCDVPITTRLGFTLRGYVSDDRVENLAAGAVTLFDSNGRLRQGSARVDFWLWHQRDRSPMNPGTVIPANHTTPSAP